VALSVDIPGVGRLHLEHLVLDVNGTISDRGRVAAGVAERLSGLTATLQVLLVSADTFGTLNSLADELNVESVRVQNGQQKLELVEQLGADHTVMVGNGANDALALGAAVLGIVVIGAEGASARALQAADVVCTSVADALDLLLDERALAATLRR
jgi:P-type E1-E2 ATPase